MSKLVYNEQILTGGIPKNQVENILGNFASEYDSALTYTVGDYVIYDGLLYKCITAVSTAETFDSSKWVKTDCGAEFSALSGSFEWKLLSSVTGHDVIYFPSNMNEFIVDVDSGSPIKMTMHFCKAQLTSDWRQYRSGWYYDPAYYSELIFNVSLSGIQLNTFWIDGANCGESCTTTVYYR